jgi:hypothetical protein
MQVGGLKVGVYKPDTPALLGQEQAQIPGKKSFSRTSAKRMNSDSFCHGVIPLF